MTQKGGEAAGKHREEEEAGPRSYQVYLQTETPSTRPLGCEIIITIGD